MLEDQNNILGSVGVIVRMMDYGRGALTRTAGFGYNGKMRREKRRNLVAQSSVWVLGTSHDDHTRTCMAWRGGGGRDWHRTNEVDDLGYRCHATRI